MNTETVITLLRIAGGLLGLVLIIGIPILFGWLIYKAVIGIIREIKKK